MMVTNELENHDRTLCWTYGTQFKEFFPDTAWDAIEAELETGWERVRRESKIEWEQARAHVRAAWEA